MESANVHHHELQDKVAGSPSCLSMASCYGDGYTAHHDLSTPNYLQNSYGLRSYPNQTNLNTRHQEISLFSSQYSSMAQDLNSHFDYSYGILQNNDQPREDLQLSRIKEEHLNGNFSNKIELYPRNLYSSCNNYGKGINISNLNQGFPNIPCSLDMNSHALDLLTYSRFGSDSIPFSLLRDGFFHGEHMQQSLQTPAYSSKKKISASSKGLAESTHANTKIQSKPSQSAAKKSRLEGRISCPPFKVRKEKVGDRIAALQQLVAPFGKTDTASVLMEAVGYIKFLQSQIETLSVPYMKSSRHKSNILMNKGNSFDHNTREEPKRDLKSRGLCLVPLPCLSYITDNVGEAAWPPPRYGGITNYDNI